MQVTFRIAEVEKLLSGKTGNMLVSFDFDKEGNPTNIKGSVLSLQKDGEELPPIDGCPFPPGCN